MTAKNMKIFLMAAILIASPMRGSLSGSGTVERIITKGETISFLSIKIYGFYNEEIVQLIKEANPSIKDLNRIQIGDKVIFPQPIDSDNKPYCIKTSASRAVVTYLTGKSTFLQKNEKVWKALEANLILHAGDKLKTGNNAMVELVINNTDVMRLSSNTELLIENMSENPGKPESSMKLGLGKFWAKIKSYVERSGKFEVGFPTAVAAVQGTVYQAELMADSTANIKVYRGEVKVAAKPVDGQDSAAAGPKIGPPRQVSGPKQVSMQQWVKIVREMQQFSFGPGMPPGDPESFTERWQGNWEKFNQERDTLFDD